MLHYVKVLGSEHVPQGGGAEQFGGLGGVGHVHHRGQRVPHLIHDHSVHGDSDTVLGQDLLGWNIECDSSQVHLDDGVNAGDDGEQARPHGAPLLNLAESEDDGSLIFLTLIIMIC